MNTDQLMQLIRKIRVISMYKEEFGPLLLAALKDIPSEEIQKAILGYEPPKK